MKTSSHQLWHSQNTDSYAASMAQNTGSLSALVALQHGKPMDLLTFHTSLAFQHPLMKTFLKYFDKEDMDALYQRSPQQLFEMGPQGPHIPHYPTTVAGNHHHRHSTSHRFLRDKTIYKWSLLSCAPVHFCSIYFIF